MSRPDRVGGHEQGGHHFPDIEEFQGPGAGDAHGTLHPVRAEVQVTYAGFFADVDGVPWGFAHVFLRYLLCLLRLNTQQQPDVMGNIFRTGVMSNGKPQAAFRVVGVGGDTVINGVGGGGAARVDAVEHPKILGQLGGGFGSGVQPHEAGVKCRGVFCEYLGGIPFRVYGDEENLHPFCVLAQELHDGCCTAQGGGADIRALGVTEEEEHDLAAPVGQGTLLACGVEQPEVLGELDIMDVLGLELGYGGCTGPVASGQQAECEGQHSHAADELFEHGSSFLSERRCERGLE